MLLTATKRRALVKTSLRIEKYSRKNVPSNYSTSFIQNYGYTCLRVFRSFTENFYVSFRVFFNKNYLIQEKKKLDSFFCEIQSKLDDVVKNKNVDELFLNCFTTHELSYKEDICKLFDGFFLDYVAAGVAPIDTKNYKIYFKKNDYGCFSKPEYSIDNHECDFFVCVQIHLPTIEERSDTDEHSFHSVDLYKASGDSSKSDKIRRPTTIRRKTAGDVS